MTIRLRWCLFAAAFALCASFVLRPSCTGHSLRASYDALRAITGPWRLPALPPPVKPEDGPHPRVRDVAAVVSGRYVPSRTVTPRDTLPVRVDVRVDTRDTIATVTIGRDTVRVDSVRVRVRIERLRWAVWAEGSPDGRGGTDFGAGVSWSPVRFAGAEIGPCVSVDMPDFGWTAAGVRISRRAHSTISAGAEVGYRIGERAGIHWGVSLGVVF